MENLTEYVKQGKRLFMPLTTLANKHKKMKTGTRVTNIIVKHCSASDVTKKTLACMLRLETRAAGKAAGL